MPDIAVLQMLPAEEDSQGAGYTPAGSTAQTQNIACGCATGV